MTAILIWLWLCCAVACAVDCYKFLRKKEDNFTTIVFASITAAIVGPVLFPYFIFRVLMSMKVEMRS